MIADRSHWLLEVARGEGLAGAQDTRLPSTTPIAEAWTAILRAAKVSPRELSEIIARRYRLKSADLRTIDARAIRLVPESLARRYHICPIREDYRKLVLATADPTDIAAEQAVQFASGRSVVFEVAPPSIVEEAILFHYSPDQAAARFLDHVPEAEGLEESIRLIEEDVQEEGPTEDILGSGPVVRLTNMIIQEAIRLNASDIHLQPTQQGGIVRYRVDGVLRTAGTMPLTALGRIVSRIKIMGRLDISDRLRPQDGRARVSTRNRNVDLRISTIPTRRAEKAVIRLLDPGSAKGLDEVGFPPEELERFESLLAYRDGIVVVTGPTGSGKTTTMYGALRTVASDDVNVMTVEDPVEFELPGTTQIQVETRQGVTFASALRAILRQDPDVIFVGEIRDPETAHVAVQAAMTGHLVLATLHTNDATGSIRRFLDLGLDIPSIVESFRGAVAQRLVRRPCPECRVPVEGDLSDSERALAATYGPTPRFRAVGCESCGQTGYRGRIPLLQILVMNAELRALVTSGGSSDRFEQAARRGGMKSLVEAGAARVAADDTTLEELDRVLGEAGDDAEDPFLGEGGSTGAVPTESGTVAAPPSASRSPGAAALPESSPRAPAQIDAESPPPGSDRPSRVLIVDDDRTIRTVARALLEFEGHAVSEADDGQAAAELISGGTIFDLIILDLNMPRMGGEDLLIRLRSAVGTVGVPVIVLTSETDPDAEVRLVDLGADDYIRKPFDPRLFVSRTGAALRRARD